ncbi:MAG TPA: glucose-6-phosphate isomerase, partial [Bacillota bacterium]|nr:glucose-6-phosphate isomerase [Bacillota bacterium]
MAQSIVFDYSKTHPYLSGQELEFMGEQVKCAHDLLHNGKGPGNDFLGWVDLPVNYDRAEFQKIQEAAANIRETAETLVVIGIGGSYLGARAAIEMLNHSFYNQLGKVKRGYPEIFYMGQTISPTYTAELLELLAEKDFAVNVI